VPRFSVVVPDHNEAEVLGRTLGSLRAQDFPGPIEVVVVDNNSTDGTGDLARAAGVRVEVEPSLGVCADRQRGTDLATGQIVVSTDADTVHPPDWLSRIDTVFRDDPDLVAVAGPCRYEHPPRWAAILTRLGFAAVAGVHALTGRVGYVTATNVAFRREGFPGYDTELTQGGDEIDLLRRLRRQGRVAWDAGNAVCTSSRRLEQGLAHTVVVSFGYYYAGGHLMNRLARRRVVGLAPPIRPADADRVRHVRRRWQLVAIGVGAVVAAGRLGLKIVSSAHPAEDQRHRQPE
jgi:glycosyltransferase involved in cell wall biosynthesis